MIYTKSECNYIELILDDAGAQEGQWDGDSGRESWHRLLPVMVLCNQR